MRSYAGICVAVSLFTLAAAPVRGQATYKGHGIAMHGDLKYGPGFRHFDYVNPAAPKGGELRLYGLGPSRSEVLRAPSPSSWRSPPCGALRISVG